MKNSKAFRLSLPAIEALRYLSEQTGVNETAIVETALMFYKRAYLNSQMDEVPKREIVTTEKPHKKRRRRR